LSGDRANATSFSVIARFLSIALLQVVEIEYGVALPVRVAVQPVRRDADDVAVFYSVAGRNVARLGPYLVGQVQVVLSQARSVGAQIESLLPISWV
jgi:hypothetical protein